MMEKIVILGGGSWGSALAISLGNKQIANTLWCRNSLQAEEMKQTRENKKYLPGVRLPEIVEITSDFEDAIQDAGVIVLAVTSQSVREIAERLKQKGILPQVVIVNVAKGLEIGTNLRMSQVVAEILPENPFVALYGPSHAEEVSRAMPTAIVAASKDLAAAEKVQDIFISPMLRIYTNTDIIGVELGGSLKNIIALANGVIVGLGYGDNSQAALLTRGLAEITRLGVALGGQMSTFLGLTGIGDLVVTCNSKHSRNRRCGIALGEGKKLGDILQDMGMVVEGVNTTKAAVELARSMGVSMPISEQMYEVLFHDADAKKAVYDLMVREKKSEQETFH